MQEKGFLNTTGQQVDVAATQELALSIYIEVSKELDDLAALPTADDLQHIIHAVRQNFPDDLNLTNAVLFFVLQHKLETLEFSYVESKETHKILHNALIAQMRIHELPTVYQRMAQGMLTLHKLMQPLYIGKDSEAKHNASERSEWVEEKVNAWVTSGDEAVYGDLMLYMDFITNITQGQFLTENSLEKFRAALTHRDETPLKYETDILATKALRGIVRTAKAAAASVVAEHVSRTPHITKEQRAQIEALYAVVMQPNVTKASYQNAQKIILEQHIKRLERESKQVTAVLNAFIHGRKNVRQTLSGVYSAFKHPLEKIYKDDTITKSTKAKKLGKVVATKTMKGVKKVAKIIGKHAAELAKKAVTKPIETVEKMSLASVNACEALELALQAQAERDPKRKARLEEQAKIKRENLGYNARKSLEALVVSGATTFNIATMVPSFGTSVPVMIGIQAAVAAHALFAWDVADNLQTGAEFLALLLTVVEHSGALENKERQELLTNIGDTIDEMVRDEEGLIKKVSMQSMSEREDASVATEAMTMTDSERTANWEDDIEFVVDENSDLATQSESEKTVDLYADTQKKSKRNVDPLNGFKNKFNKVITEIKDPEKATDDPTSKPSRPQRN